MSILIIFPTFETEKAKDKQRNEKSESKKSLFSLFNFTGSENVTQCCYTLLCCFGNVKFDAGGGMMGTGCRTSPGERGFQIRMEILRLRENCLQEPFSDSTDT